MAITKVKTLGITDANVTAAKLSTDSVETAKITASNVTNAKLGSDISAAKLTAGTISGDRLPAPTLTIKGDGSSADGKLTLNCSQNSHGVSIQAPPHSAAQSYNLVLPSTAPGANKILQTDGSGNLSWVDQGASGKIGQVLGMTKTDTTSLASTSFADISGMTIAITPTKTSSKILLAVNLSIGAYTVGSAGKIQRDIGGGGYSDLLIGDAASSRTRCTWHFRAATGGVYTVDPFNCTFLDSPSTTSATTYKIQWAATGGNTIYLNRSWDDTDSANYPRSASSMTVMEVLA